MIYIFYGYLQSKGYSFLDWMAYDRTSVERGVTSFAPEPTHLGMILFFLSWLIFNSIQKINDRKIVFISYLTIAINIYGIFFLAISAMSMMFILITFL